MINKAIEFATRAHAGQFRKGTSRPYIVHPIEVGDIVSTMTKDKEIISAAVLHDTIEDCAGVSRELLAEEFSERELWHRKAKTNPRHGWNGNQQRSSISVLHQKKCRW